MNRTRYQTRLRPAGCATQLKSLPHPPERVDVFVLGDVDGLQEGLGQVGDGAGGFGFYIAADYGGDEA